MEYCQVLLVGLIPIIIMWFLLLREKVYEKKCRVCGTTKNPCIVYEKDMLCRKCFDETIPYAIKSKEK